MKIHLFFVILLWFVAPSHSQYQKPFQLALDFKAKYQIDSAYYYMQRAISVSQHTNDQQKAQLFLHYGKMLKLKEKTDSSFLYYQKAIELFDHHKNSDSILYTKTLIAELFRFRGVAAKAKQYILEAEQLIRPSTPTDILAYYYNRRAGIEAMFFSSTLAESLSKKVIALQDSIHDKEIVVYSHNELGYLYEKTNAEKSQQHYLAALKLVDEHALIAAKVDVLTLLSRIGNNTNQKLNYLEQAFEIAQSINNQNMIYNVSKRLYVPYLQMGNYEKAAKYCDIALRMQSNIYDSKIIAKTEEIEHKYNYKKAKQALKYKDAEMQTAKKTLLLTILIALLSVTVLFFVIFFYNKTRNKNKQLKQLSDENGFLLMEANHRINNNLQLIIVLITDQLPKLNKQEQEALQKVLSKVESIATLHRHLYKSPNKQFVDCGNYLDEILCNFSAIFTEKGIQTQFKVDGITVPNEQAIYLGLLVTELIINSLKHAFPNQIEKTIHFTFKQRKDRIVFAYSDNGQSNNGNPIKPKLIERLCSQLKIQPTISTDNGFLFYFEKNNDQK